MKRRLAMLAAAILTALALTVGGLTAQPAVAQDVGLGISACSYAANYCRVWAWTDQPTTVTFEWYTTWAGVYRYSSDGPYYFPANTQINANHYIRYNERADQVIIHSSSYVTNPNYTPSW